MWVKGATGKPAQPQMGSRRVYVAIPGQVPDSADAIRDDNARGTVTVECRGAATEVSISRGAAALVIGNRGKASVGVLGTPPAVLAECRKKCKDVLGHEYFTEDDEVFFPPRDDIFRNAIQVLEAVIDKTTSRASVTVERPPSAEPEPAPVERPEPAAEPEPAPVERPEPAAEPEPAVVERPPSAAPVDRPRRPSTSSSFAETHAAKRAIQALEKRVEKLRRDQARAEKNPNRVLRVKFVRSIGVQLANASAELEAARRAA